MVDDKRLDKSEDMNGDLGAADVIARLRAIPRLRPRAVFRFKVALVSRFPDSAFLGHILGTPERADEGADLVQLRRAVLKPAMVAMVAASVILLLMMGLMLLAGGSRPGDALYALKRARERVEMSFTRDPVSRAKKELALAERRLSELDSLIVAGSLDPERIKYIADEYGKNKKQVKQVIESNINDSEASRLQANLDSIENQKDNIVARMSTGAGPGDMQVPASGAKVTVRDSSGRDSLGSGSPSIVGQVDENGELEFEYLAADAEDAACVEAIVELDGRKTRKPISLYRACETASSGDTRGAVSAVLTPLPGKGNRVELDNGVIRVTADGHDSGAVIGKISAVKDDVGFGPLKVTFTDGNGYALPGDNVDVKGPYLVPGVAESAAYEINYDLELDGATVHNSCRVSLAKGDDYVSVSCETSVDNGKDVNRSADEELPVQLRFSLPLGTNARVAGEPVKVPGNSSKPVTVVFSEKYPFATFNSYGKTISIIYPDCGPTEWYLDGKHLEAIFSSAPFNTEESVDCTALIGFMGDEDAARLSDDPDLADMIDARYDHTFYVACSQDLEKLKPGRHTITLTIRKRYEELGDYFE